MNGDTAFIGCLRLLSSDNGDGVMQASHDYILRALGKSRTEMNGKPLHEGYLGMLLLARWSAYHLKLIGYTVGV